MVKLQIREIQDDDVDSVIDLLARGFPISPKSNWERGFRRLRSRTSLPDMPKYGFMLEADDVLVGAILLISSQRWIGHQWEPFANLSSWYVEPQYRSYAAQLLRRTLTHKQATYLAISAAVNVRPMYEALGFKRYTRGQFVAAAALARNRERAAVQIFAGADLRTSGLEERERRLLETQAEYGCISFCCVADGRTYPFVFLPRRIKGLIRCAQLVYCRSVSDFVEVAGSLGRYLLWRGWPLVLLDADGPIDGLPGKYFDNATPKYFRGPNAPVVNDLSETEATIFGIDSGPPSFLPRSVRGEN